MAPFNYMDLSCHHVETIGDGTYYFCSEGRLHKHDHHQTLSPSPQTVQSASIPMVIINTPPLPRTTPAPEPSLEFDTPMHDDDVTMLTPPPSDLFDTTPAPRSTTNTNTPDTTLLLSSPPQMPVQTVGMSEAERRRFMALAENLQGVIASDRRVLDSKIVLAENLEVCSRSRGRLDGEQLRGLEGDLNHTLDQSATAQVSNNFPTFVARVGMFLGELWGKSGTKEDEQALR